MACQGRAIATATSLLLLLLVVYAAPDGAKYTVGDGAGWTYGISAWSTGKSFKAGDVLRFNYMSSFHNVVRVDEGHYTNCTAPANAKVYTTGTDEIVLSKGSNYFICSLPLHCQFGMKISAVAT